jgi:hypothetical protein
VSELVELTVKMPERAASVRAVSYCGRHEVGTIRLFMLLSLFPSDHAVFYLFFDGAPTVDRVQAFADLNKEAFGYRLVVVDMGQSFTTIEAADQRAQTLREAFPRANVMFPPATLAEPATT